MKHFDRHFDRKQPYLLRLIIFLLLIYILLVISTDFEENDEDYIEGSNQAFLDTVAKYSALLLLEKNKPIIISKEFLTRKHPNFMLKVPSCIFAPREHSIEMWSNYDFATTKPDVVAKCKKVPAADARLSFQEYDDMFAACEGYNATIVVVLATYLRPNNLDNEFMFLTRALQSLRKQKYPHWMVMIAGDGMKEENAHKVIKVCERELSAFNKRWILTNMPSDCSEKNIPNISWNHLYSTGGAAALNTLLSVPEIKKYTVIARLDDDDYYYSTHLSSLAAGYALFDAGFVWTAAIIPLNNNAIFPVTGIKEIGIGVRLPYGEQLIHASASWKINLNMFYRAIDQFPAVVKNISAYDNTVGIAPGDADMWYRFYALAIVKNISTIYDPRESIVYEKSRLPPYDNY